MTASRLPRGPRYLDPQLPRDPQLQVGLIWATSIGRPGRPEVLGRQGTLPWHLPEDLAHFREITYSHPVIMGRTTWDSLPDRFRPLPGRRNIVLTRDPDWVRSGAEAVADPAGALRAVATGLTWVIGGGQVYQAFARRADRIEITEIDIDLGDPQPGDVNGFGWTHSGTASRTEGPWLNSTTGLRYRFLSLDWTNRAEASG